MKARLVISAITALVLAILGQIRIASHGFADLLGDLPYQLLDAPGAHILKQIGIEENGSHTAAIFYAECITNFFIYLLLASAALSVVHTIARRHTNLDAFERRMYGRH